MAVENDNIHEVSRGFSITSNTEILSGMREADRDAAVKMHDRRIRGQITLSRVHMAQLRIKEAIERLTTRKP